LQVTFHKEDEMGEDPGAFPKQAGLGLSTARSPFRKGRSRKSFRPRAILWESFARQPHGSALSGETRATLEFLCEQLPGALDLCRLIDEKVRLERELAERERLALLGQMAASISHNLKKILWAPSKRSCRCKWRIRNSPKPCVARRKIVLNEVGRLSAKLNQLLQFSRPAVLGGNAAAACDARLSSKR